MVHKIKHFFQYQEEKQQHSENWEDSGSFSKKQPLLTTPSSAQPRPHDAMDAAELSYYEHKSKLRKTQVTHRAAGEEWEGEQNLEDGEEVSQKTGGGRSLGHPPSHKYSRAPRDRPGEPSGNGFTPPKKIPTETPGSRPLPVWFKVASEVSGALVVPPPPVEFCVLLSCCSLMCGGS